MGVEVARLLRLVNGLPDVENAVHTNYTTLSVRGRKFGYLWPRTSTVGLKQTMSEQIALVTERPDVFEVQFTAGGFGWVVVYLERIELDELSELVLEAWRLSAPEELLADHPTPQELVDA
ncbi:MmcQ/YjbR family DNA-binding protein [Pseudonocardia spinosispora]|uniref:MmcQ/YjbR family DNA-binding protein n=1 Tax=Pseudonocardia spinosispora TaxID=103441 RepID=UPI0003FEC3D5|nr:MmcQ/YjbR family DNA-binding protein [Pseudonocardia spinosispora]